MEQGWLMFHKMTNILIEKNKEKNSMKKLNWGLYLCYYLPQINFKLNFPF